MTPKIIPAEGFVYNLPETTPGVEVQLASIDDVKGRLGKNTYPTFTALNADTDREDGIYKVLVDDGENGDGGVSYFLSFSGELHYIVTISQI